MLLLHLKRDPMSSHRLHPVQAIIRARGMLLAAGLLVACGGDPVTVLPPPSNDQCFGDFILLAPQGRPMAVGDSLRITARPLLPAFTSCFPGVVFRVEWETSVEGVLGVAVDSDTTAMVRGLAPGTVDLKARVPNSASITGVMRIVVQ